MNAPPRPQLQRQNYEPAVKALVPGCEGEELDRRCVLCLIRDGATARKRTCHDKTYQLYDTIEDMAAASWSAPMGLDQMAELELILKRIAAVARDLEGWCRG